MNFNEFVRAGQRALQEKYKLTDKKAKSKYFKDLAKKSVASRKAKKLQTA